MIKECSVWSYNEIKESGYVGKRQAQYLFIFVSQSPEPLTHRQASDFVNRHFGLNVPQRNGRIAELEQMGFLEKFDTVVCPATLKRVNRWVFSGQRRAKTYYWRKVECKCCKGSGQVFQKVYQDQ